MILGGLLWSCSGSPPPGGGGEPAPVPVADAAPAASLTPVIVPAGVAAPAPPWFEPLPEDADQWADPIDLGDVRLQAVGERSALVATSKGGLFAVDGARGVVGLVKGPPGAVWFGIGGTGDAVFAADGAGTLFRAVDLDAAVAGGFTEVARLPGAVAWDATAGLVAGATADRVHYATGRGDRLRPAPRFSPRPPSRPSPCAPTA
jgi:hypothetical protein